MFSFGIKDVIDILIVSILLFQVYKLLKGTQAMNIFFAVLGFIIMWFLVRYVFRMDLLGSIFNAIMNFGAIILIILFQDEIKAFLTTMGSRTSKGIAGKIKGLFFGADSIESEMDIESIIEATENCARYWKPYGVRGQSLTLGRSISPCSAGRRPLRSAA